MSNLASHNQEVPAAQCPVFIRAVVYLAVQICVGKLFVQSANHLIPAGIN